MNRREFFTGAATVPIIGDVLTPWAVELLDKDGQVIRRDPQRDLVRGTLCVFAHMEITGPEIARVKDDAEWRAVLQTKSDELANNMYEYVKRAARREASTINKLVPDRIQMRSMQKSKGTYVYAATKAGEIL